MFNGTEGDLVLSPNKDINGEEFIEFRVGDTLTLVTNLHFKFFFTPVVDAPVVQIRNTEIQIIRDRKCEICWR